MSSFTVCCLLGVAIVLGINAFLVDAIGFPMMGGGCGCGSGGGAGGGGGCGRKKREAVQPHYKADETPCPQAAWKELLEQAILPEDAIASVNAIQTALFKGYADQKFMVTCARAGDDAKTGGAAVTTKTNKVHFSSSGDGYCNLVKERVWCQAVALSA